MADIVRPSPAVRRVLKKLGEDLKEARLRRHLPQEVIASRARTTRKTLTRIENGDPGVKIAIYAAVMQALGLLDGLAEAAAPSRDSVGQQLTQAELPKRARPPVYKVQRPNE